MNKKSSMFFFRRFFLTSLYFLFFFVQSATSYALTPETSDQKLIDESVQEFKLFFLKYSNEPHALIKGLNQARGVMLCPHLQETSSLLSKGNLDGKCILIGRDSTGGWSSPAFYHLKRGGLHFSLSDTQSKLIIFLMTQKALEAFVDKDFYFTKNTGLSFLSILRKSRILDMRDLYVAKIINESLTEMPSLSGIRIIFDMQASHDYYKKQVEPMDILISMKVNQAKASGLRRTVMEVLH